MKKHTEMITLKSIIDNLDAIKSWGEAGNSLSALNTMRGGLNGNKGFVAEYLQAAEASAAGRATRVLDNNGVADLAYTGKNCRTYLQQMKVGYKPSQIDFAKYKGQTLVVDKGNPYFREMVKRGKLHGVKVIEGSITNEEAAILSKAMQLETTITGAKMATVVPRVVTAGNAGWRPARSGALYGAGFSLATNVVDVLNGEKELGDAALDVVKNTAMNFGTSYVAGMAGSAAAGAGSAVAGTSAGAAAIGAVSSAGSAVAGTTVGGAVIGAGTTVGSAVIGAGTAATGAVAAAGTAATGAVVGAVGTVGSAVGGAAVAATAGTVVGGAVATGVAGAAATAAVAGAAAVAAAPVVAVGATVGLVYKGIKSLLD